MKATLLIAPFMLLGPLSCLALAESDCVKLSVGVRHAVEAKPSAVLEIVEAKVATHESCACEIVKAAIAGSKADAELVASIVETAAMVAPEHMRLISQCAIAVAPDSLSNVQAVLIRLDPNQGEGYSAKGAKAIMVAPASNNIGDGLDVMPAWNPLNFPGQGVGPNPGGPGGFPLIPPIPPYPPLPPDVPFIPNVPATPTQMGGGMP